MKRIALILYIILVVGCQSTDSSTNNTININKLSLYNDVKKAGRELVSLSNGLNKVDRNEQHNDSTLIVAVHGYESEGYEWVHFLSEFSKQYPNIYFYRYDWDNCPDELGIEFANTLDSLISIKSEISQISIFGHSYGGLVITYAAAELQTDKKISINTIASPLAGYPRIMDECRLEYSEQNQLVYSAWNSNISHHQWRTQKEQDGAFRKMDYDPQELDIYNSTVTVLPDSMDGHRLGHNWAVTWVTNYLLDNE